MKDEKNKKEPRVYWPSPGPGMRCLILGDTITAIWVHWSELSRRTLACPGADNCPLCASEKRARWVGFVPSLLPGKTRAVTQLTWEAARSLLDGMDAEDTFRRAMVSLKRVGRARESRVICAFLGRLDEEKCAPAFEVLPTLAKLFGPITRSVECLPSDLQSVFYFDPSQTPD